MKKFITTLLIVLFILSLSLPAFADVDLDSMSLDELVDLDVRIQEEIAKRMSSLNDQYTIIPAGRYYAGIDIDFGSYEVSPVNEEIYISTLVWKEKYEDYGTDQYEEVAPGEYLRFTFQEGDNKYLYLEADCYIRPGKTISFK